MKNSAMKNNITIVITIMLEFEKDFLLTFEVNEMWILKTGRMPDKCFINEGT